MTDAIAAEHYIGWAEAEAERYPGIEDVAPRPVRAIGVVGGGTMGVGIAIALLSSGYSVTIVDRNPAAVGRAVDGIERTIGDNAASGRIGPDAAAKASAALRFSTDIAALGHVDLAIEAAFETMAVKQAIFRELDRVLRPGAVLASNTSYLDIAAIAAVTDRPADVLGLHFFSPAHIMKLIEIVRTPATAMDVIATGLAVARRLGKRPVVAGNAYGFIGNRMLAVRRQEAEGLLLDGVSPERIDLIVEGFGFRMGPFRIGDLAGLDLGWSAETSTGSTIRERLCDAGRRGEKTRAGFYDYGDDRRPRPSAEALEIIAGFARDRGHQPRAWTDEAILDRMLLPMIDEGAQLLAEGVAQRESDIDVVWINGYGWPRRTGGPMYHGREIGLADIEGKLAALGRTPSPALQTLARSDRPAPNPTSVQEPSA
ncbi:3-hydroxyacyl-CoA dehydrogenase [Sphingomonas fuzhouensis]|uniref:3-hydroxyacyl-CoA dehydrogenase n=1 Tax=Sphingomonas fuzhouensis TaxID=3106033 RepID=UPI002AFDE35A|nr:3-hydroxyacyl-CoA dehydrogenase NAD-binding domain-containing protein [Sphingomonas sp. SGZ-02]